MSDKDKHLRNSPQRTEMISQSNYYKCFQVEENRTKTKNVFRNEERTKHEDCKELMYLSQEDSSKFI